MKIALKRMLLTLKVIKLWYIASLLVVWFHVRVWFCPKTCIYSALRSLFFWCWYALLLKLRTELYDAEYPVSIECVFPLFQILFEILFFLALWFIKKIYHICDPFRVSFLNRSQCSRRRPPYDNNAIIIRGFWCRCWRLFINARIAP